MLFFIRLNPQNSCHAVIVSLKHCICNLQSIVHPTNCWGRGLGWGTWVWLAVEREKHCQSGSKGKSISFYIYDTEVYGIMNFSLWGKYINGSVCWEFVGILSPWTKNFHCMWHVCTLVSFLNAYVGTKIHTTDLVNSNTFTLFVEDMIIYVLTASFHKQIGFLLP